MIERTMVISGFKMSNHDIFFGDSGRLVVQCFGPKQRTTNTIGRYQLIDIDLQRNVTPTIAKVLNQTPMRGCDVDFIFFRAQNTITI